MAAKRVKPPQRELTVVLDTNALYTGSASYFVRKEVADLIGQHTTQPDLCINWVVPEVVRHERQFQMLQEATQMLPTIERLERLLGHKLNITPDILQTRVQEAVDRQVHEHAIKVQPLNAAQVDWQRLMLDATYRKPPFQLGEKEKGFRDALILETFVQLVAATPTNRSVARLALVSNDGLLRDAAAARVGAASNIHVLESIDALKGLINTLASTVDEQFIEAIRGRAAEVFFRVNDENTFYYKASIAASLDETLTKAHFTLPNSADRYAVGKWTISRPRFVKKQGQRIYWTTRFEARLKALKSSAASPWQPALFSPSSGNVLTTSIPSTAGITFGSLTADVSSSGFLNPHQGVWSSSPTVGSASPVVGSSGPTVGSSSPLLFGELVGVQEQVIGQGAASLDVNWSVVVTTSGVLKNPQLESIQFVEAIWG